VSRGGARGAGARGREAGLCAGVATSQRGDLGALGEKRATLAESEGWGWARGDSRTESVSSLLRLGSSSAAAGASLGCAGCLSPACSEASLAVGGYWGHWGRPGQSPPHTSRRFHLPTARLLSQILGEGWQEEEGEEDDGAGHPPACPEGAG